MNSVIRAKFLIKDPRDLEILRLKREIEFLRRSNSLHKRHAERIKRLSPVVLRNQVVAQRWCIRQYKNRLKELGEVWNRGRRVR